MGLPTLTPGLRPMSYPYSMQVAFIRGEGGTNGNCSKYLEGPMVNGKIVNGESKDFFLKLEYLVGL